MFGTFIIDLFSHIYLIQLLEMLITHICLSLKCLHCTMDITGTKWLCVDSDEYDYRISLFGLVFFLHLSDLCEYQQTPSP